MAFDNATIYQTLWDRAELMADGDEFLIQCQRRLDRNEITKEQYDKLMEHRKEHKWLGKR